MIMSLLAFPFLLTSCLDDAFLGIEGRGELITQTIDMEELSGFNLTIAADVYVSYGDKQEITIEAQENILDNIDFDWVRNGIWTIRYYHWVRRAKPVKIYLTLNELDKVVLTGSGNITGDNHFTDLEDLELVITGSGNLDLGFDCQRLDLTISGSGDMNLTGSAEELNGLITGSGHVDGYDLATREADIRITGSGDCRLTVEDYLRVLISGSGSVIYLGDPGTSIHITGSGEVRRNP